MKVITVIDLEISNVQSVVNMCRRTGAEVKVCKDPPVSPAKAKSEFIILPGVGAFDRGSVGLSTSGWSSFLVDAAESGVPILGLCLGMQLLCESSEEGERAGLGLIPGNFVRIANHDSDGNRLKVPHMGWNQVTFNRDRASWAPEPTPTPRYYFVHSFRYSHINDEQVLGNVWYGQNFAAVIGNGNVVGLQFHPEKSHRYGLELLKRIFDKLC